MIISTGPHFLPESYTKDTSFGQGRNNNVYYAGTLDGNRRFAIRNRVWDRKHGAMAIRWAAISNKQGLRTRKADADRLWGAVNAVVDAAQECGAPGHGATLVAGGYHQPTVNVNAKRCWNAHMDPRSMGPTRGGV